MSTFTLGPLAIPAAPLLLLAAVLTGTAVAKLAERGSDHEAVHARRAEIESLLWKALLAGVIGARFAFVGAYFDSYKNDPWSILDIRDGGFSLVAGIGASLLMAAWSAWNKRDIRKPFAISAAAGAAVWVIGTLALTQDRAEPAGMPQVTLTRLDGSAVALSSLAGKPMVVNLWATWCPPCRREMPVLRDAQARHRDIVFVFANQGESADAVRGFLDAEHLALENVLLDPHMSLGTKTGSNAFPTTLFYDGKGVLVDRRLGELSAATLAQRIDALRTAK